MKHQLRSSFSTQGRRMAGARALWTANGMKKEQMGKPIIAIVNSFTQFVPGHVHLHEIGQFVKEEIEKLGCFAAEFNTIAIDDGIAMGHDGMLYSLPSRDIIASLHTLELVILYRSIASANVIPSTRRTFVSTNPPLASSSMMAMMPPARLTSCT